MKILNLITMLSFLLQSCGSKDPTQNDIIGTWESRDGATMVFNKDRTFIGKALPAANFSFYTSKSEVAGKIINGSGNWALKKEQAFQEVNLNFERMDNKEVHGQYSIMISGEKGILENQPPWYLFVWKEEEGGDRFKFYRK